MLPIYATLIVVLLIGLLGYWIWQREPNPVAPRRKKTVREFLLELSDPRQEKLFSLYQQYEELMLQAKGSKSKHQAWPGGYLDHIAETFRLSEMLYETLSHHYDLSFSLDSALIVLFFHDWEKFFKSSDKYGFLKHTLPEKFGIALSSEEWNALCYVHGEGGDYDPYVRVMNELAGFVHSVDTLSARTFHQAGREEGC